jgi:hypothetical protein
MNADELALAIALKLERNAAKAFLLDNVLSLEGHKITTTVTGIDIIAKVIRKSAAEFVKEHVRGTAPDGDPTIGGGKHGIKGDEPVYQRAGSAGSIHRRGESSNGD